MKKLVVKGMNTVMKGKRFAHKLLKNERGGVNGIVVAVGLALIALVVLAASKTTIASSISSTLTSLFTKLTNLGT